LAVFPVDFGACLYEHNTAILKLRGLDYIYLVGTRNKRR
jgi:hypothetical protein